MDGFWIVSIISAVAILAMSLIHFVSSDPVRSKRSTKNKDIRFQPQDFLVLAALLILPVAFAVTVYDQNGQLFIYQNLLYPAIAIAHWRHSARALTRAGVESRLHRTILTLFTIPLVWIGAYGLAASSAVICAFIYAGNTGPWRNDWGNRTIQMITIAAGSALLLFLSRTYISWLYRNRGTVAHEPPQSVPITH